MNYIKNSNDIESVNKIIEYGEQFWIDYFIYLCNCYPVKEAAVLYNEKLQLFIN